MNRKLAIRNVMRLAKDYLVYFLTMTFVTALMFAFNSILFSEDVQKLFDIAGMMAAMVGIATFFIVWIIAWLIHYMVRFILEKRSREFGIYLLIGMKKKEIAKLYLRENAVLGSIAFILGMGLGMLLQQILMSILYGMIQMNYHLKLEMNGSCFLMTAGCYAGCYILALFRLRKRFQKMNIHDLMEVQKKNEEITEKREKIKRWLFPVSILFLIIFGVLLLSGGVGSTGSIVLFLVGLVLVIYLFYTGLSAWIICYVRKKGKAVYKGENLFLLRQFASKLKTMRFTMGTLTSLFTIAFLGCTAAMMFSDYQQQVLNNKFPFDVQIYNREAGYDFQKELSLLHEETDVKESYTYRIYTDGTNEVNTWLYTHLKYFGTIYKNEDGTPNEKKIRTGNDQSYCNSDTFMSLTDYNHLRRMLGYRPAVLEENEYLIHLKERIHNELGDFSKNLSICEKINEGKALSFAGYRTEPFSQDGHNGGDYVIVVPDHIIEKMTPYYSELAVDLNGKAPQSLSQKLDNLCDDLAFGDQDEKENNWCFGSDTVVTYAAVNLVRDNAIPEVRYMLSAIIFPAFYVGLVFVCVALTVLSVQQLSDSTKYRFRYDVLRKLGLDRRELSRTVRKQLIAYYLCPALFAAGISGIIGIYMSRKFIFFTGVSTSIFQYFGIAFILFFGIYTVYFIATYVGFRRNIDENV